MLKPGDKVIMNDQYFVSRANENRIWKVTSEPWELPDGTWVVKLKGKTGCYAVDGLDLVPKKG